MSFRLTTDQFLDGSKDVTRRLGWAHLKPGEHFMAVRQAQGLKKGESVQRLGECVCLRNKPEELREIIWSPYRSPIMSCIEWRGETAREGFPDLTPIQFVEMFCREMSTKQKSVELETIVNRIEFRREVTE